MAKLIYPHLGLFYYHLDDQDKENKASLDSIEKQVINNYPIDGFCYHNSFGDTDGLLVFTFVTFADEQTPVDLPSFVSLKQVVSDKTKEILASKSQLKEADQIGKTWLVLGVISPGESEGNIVKDIVKNLKFDAIFTKPEDTPPQKFRGVNFYELELTKSFQPWKNLEDFNDHLVIMFFQDTKELGDFNNFKDDLFKLFLYRHKITWAYNNCQQKEFKKFLKKNLLPDTKAIVLSLPERQKELSNNYNILAEYVQYLTYFEIQLQTIETNAYNYKGCLSSLVKKAQKKGETDPDILGHFSDFFAIKYQKQVERDIAALKPGLLGREMFINAIGSNVDLEKAEIDRRLENSIALIGIGIGVASAAASSISPFIEVITNLPTKTVKQIEVMTNLPTKTVKQNVEINIPGNAWLNFILAMFISIVAGALGVGITYLASKFLKWRKRSKSNR